MLLKGKEDARNFWRRNRKDLFTKDKGRTKKGRTKKYWKVHVPFHNLDMLESQKPCLNFRAICRNLQAQKCTHARCLYQTNQLLFSAPVNCLQWPNTCWAKRRGCRQEHLMTEESLAFKKYIRKLIPFITSYITTYHSVIHDTENSQVGMHPFTTRNNYDCMYATYYTQLFSYDLILTLLTTLMKLSFLF